MKRTLLTSCAAALVATAALSSQGRTQLPGIGSGMIPKPAPAYPQPIDVDAKPGRPGPSGLTPAHPVPFTTEFRRGALERRAPTNEDKSEVGAASRFRTAGFRPDHVVFDTDEHGAIWSGAVGFKCRVDARGLRFIPALGAGAPRSEAVDFRLSTVTSNRGALSLDRTAKVSRVGRRIVLDHGGCTERFDVSADGVEQSFEFDELPGRGELVLSIEATSRAFVGSLDLNGGGIRFRGPDGGGVDYGSAIAFDARGRRVDVISSYESGRIVHRVPEWFVAEAELPLVVDPLVSAVSPTPRTFDLERPDVGYEPSTDTFCVVWQRPFSATDTDIYLEHFRPDGSAVLGTAVAYDLSINDYATPAVAGRRVDAEFLIAASVRLSGQTDRVIRVRVRGAATPFANSPWSTISGTETGTKLAPDVGGDYNASPPTYWTVVWERHYSASDIDIHFRQVASGAIARGTTVQYAENSSANDYAPRISESCGDSAANTQNWGIVWTRRDAGTDIYGSFVKWDGSITQTAFPIDTRGELSQYPDISSISNSRAGDRWFVAVYESGQTKPRRDIMCKLIGVNTGIQDEVEIASNRGFAMNRPAVDGDGERFVVSCQRDFVSRSDPDIVAWSLGIDPTPVVALVELEQQVTLASTGTDELRPRVASRYGDADPLFPFHAFCAWTDMRSSRSTSIIEAAIFSAQQGDWFDEFQHGCGSIDLAVSSLYWTGSQVQARVTNASGVHGVLVGPLYAIPVPCGPCLLGVQGSPFVSPLSFDIPRDASLVGTRAAIQGYQLSGGPCVGGVQLTNTKAFQVR